MIWKSLNATSGEEVYILKRELGVSPEMQKQEQELPRIGTLARGESSISSMEMAPSAVITTLHIEHHKHNSNSNNSIREIVIISKSRSKLQGSHFQHNRGQLLQLEPNDVRLSIRHSGGECLWPLADNNANDETRKGFRSNTD
eukprot:scaffold13249_cov98-Cylindrotheca_fusiformis.AAC.2